MARLSTRAATPWVKLEPTVSTGWNRSVEATRKSSWETRLVAIIVITFAILASVFASPILYRRISIHGDLGMHFLPVKGLYAGYLQAGQDFDWAPQLFGGYFLTGEGQHGPYHPLHLLMYRWVPLDIAFAIETFIPILILGVGMVVFLRKYINLSGACLGGVLAAFSSNFVIHMQQPCITAIISHIPWMLIAIDWAINATTWLQRQRALGAIALLTGSQVLLGHPQSLWFSLLTCSLFGLYTLIARRKGWQAWFTVAAGMSLGLCLGAVQLLATMELLSTTDRTVMNIKELPYPTCKPRTLIGLISPAIVHDEMFPPYFGAVPVVLALWWLTAFRLRPDSDQTIQDNQLSQSSINAWRRDPVVQLSFWAALAVILLMVLSLGKTGGLYRLQMWLPLVGRFRGPVRYLMVSQICAAILSAVAFARLVHFCRTNRTTSRTHLALPWVCVAVSIMLAVSQFRSGNYHLKYLEPQSLVYVGPLLFAAATLALTLASRGTPSTRQWGLGLLVMVAFADLTIYSVTSPGVGRIYWKNLPTYEEYLAVHPRPPVPAEELSGRIVHQGNPGDWLRRINPYLLMGYHATDGNAGLYVRRALSFYTLNSLRVAETAYYWQPWNDICRVTGLTPPPAGGWCPISNPMPRARLVADTKVSTNPGVDIDNIELETTALVTHEIPLPVSDRGTAKVLNDQPGHIALTVQAPAKQLLVLTESYHRAWRVTVDDKPVELEQVNGDFIGCLVSEGEHRVNFDFRSDTLRLGKSISLASLGVIFVLSLGLPSIWTDWRQRRSTDRQSSLTNARSNNTPD